VGLAPNLGEKIGFGPEIEVMLQMREYGKTNKNCEAYFVRIEVRTRIPLYAVVRFEFLQQNHVCIKRSICNNRNVL
jgi:hypothetical protein